MALPTGLLYRWRADDLTLSSGTAVQTWAPMTGTATLSQATSSARPVFRTGGINGHSYVDFLGGNFLTAPAGWTGPGSIIMVLRYAPGDGTERIVIDGDPGSAVSERVFVGLDRNTAGDTMRVRLYAGTSINGSYLATPSEMVITCSHGSAGQAFVNGDVSVSPANTGVGNPAGITLGADNAGGRSFVGHVYEVMVFDRILTAEERANAHSYVQDTYGITVSDYVAGTTPTDPVAPIVDAGLDANVVIGNVFSRTGTVNDGGSPITSYSWAVVEGPSGVLPLSDTADLNWTPDSVGTYILEFSATNSIGSGSDQVTVNVGDTGIFPTLPWDNHPGTMTSLTEESDFIDALSAATDRVRVVPLGTSAQGRPIRAAIVGPPRSRDDIRNASNYMVLGSHHGDEWAGREALFEDMRDHALGSGDETVVYIPTVNPDGLLIPDRELANGIDPNRLWSPTGIDQTTTGVAYQPEQQAVRQAILLYWPKLILDTHEYGTTTTTYRFDPGTTNSTGTPQAVIDAVQASLNELRPEATTAGYTIADYTGSIPDDGGTQAWKRGGIPAIFTESPQQSPNGLTERRAQQLTSLDALRRWVRKNTSTLDAVSASAVWFRDYAPTLNDAYSPARRSQATLVAVERSALAGSGTTIPIPRPQGIEVGDYLLCVAVDATETVAVEPTGWTPLIPMANIDFGPNMYVMERWVDGSEPTSWTWTVPSTKTNLVVMAWRGVDPASAMDVVPQIVFSTTGWPAAPAITTVTENTAVLVFGAGIGPSGDIDVRWISDGDEDIRSTSGATSSTNPAVVSTSRSVYTPSTVAPSLNPVETLATRGAIVTLALRPTAVSAGFVIDRWDGTSLVRQKIERWDGTSLVPQLLEIL